MTQVKRSTLFPVWSDQQFFMYASCVSLVLIFARPLPPEAHHEGVKLIVDCYDWDDITANDHIGILSFNIFQIPGNFKVTGRWFHLQCKDTDDAKVIVSVIF